MRKLLIFLLLGIFLINLVNAISCVPSSINKEINIGTTPSSTSMTCSNNNNYEITIYKSAETFFFTDPNTPITIQNNSEKTFLIKFNEMNEEDDGDLFSTDGSIIHIDVDVIESSTNGNIIVFPTAKVVNVQQSQIKNQNIQIIVPSNYGKQVTIQSVSFNPDIDVIRFGDLDLGVLNPGQTLNIPLIIDANGVQTGPYNTQISILATDDDGQISLPSINLKIVVSVGVNPSTNETFSTRPSCSLSSVDFNLNDSYTFTCSNTVENLEISPIYNEFLEGIKADYSGGTYTYTFKATKLGTSTFVATFIYKGSPIFQAYSQDFKVTPSGSSSVGSITIKPQFFQLGKEKNIDNLRTGETVIVATDNKTGNLIIPFTLYLNGEMINKTTIELKSDEIYNLRITANGYNDLVIPSLSVSESPITITIYPNKEWYSAGEEIIINTTPENASLLFADNLITSPYILESIGNYTLKAILESYTTTNRTIEVRTQVSYRDMSPPLDEWKKGKEVIILLTKNVSWQVYKDDVPTEYSGEGDKVEFKIDSYGVWVIKSGNQMITGKEIKKSDTLFWFFPRWKWYWYLGGIVLIIVIIYIVKGKSSGGEEKTPAYEYTT